MLIIATLVLIFKYINDELIIILEATKEQQLMLIENIRLNVGELEVDEMLDDMLAEHLI